MKIEKPEMTVVRFDAADIIATSDPLSTSDPLFTTETSDQLHTGTGDTVGLDAQTGQYRAGQ